MNVAHLTLEELLPHKPPMRLLDSLVHASSTSVHCRLVLRRDCTFVEADRVDAVVFLEYMAQAACAFAGLHSTHAATQGPVALLLGTRELVLFVSCALVGDVLDVHATKVGSIDALAQFACEVRCKSALFAKATLSVLLRTHEHDVRST